MWKPWSPFLFSTNFPREKGQALPPESLCPPLLDTFCQCPKKIAYSTLWTHYPPEHDPREAGPVSIFCSVHNGAGCWEIT